MAEEHDTHINLTVKDKSSGAVEKMTRHIEKLGERSQETLSKLTEMGGALAGLAGAFSFERMIDTGKESLEQINKLSKLTDMTADHVAAMRDTFEQSGLGAEQMARSMTMLSKKALQLDENGKAITAEARRWGVDLKKGPEAALYSIADAVQKHRIGQAEVLKLTGASRENLGGMMELLQGGKEELKKNVEEAAKLNQHLAGNEALERFKKFHEASEKIHQAWRRISEKVVVALAPALERISTKLSGWLDKLNVDKFVNTLVKGLELAVAHAKLLGRIMLTNMILQRTMGTGLISNVMNLARRGAGLGARLGGAIASGGSSMLAAGAGQSPALVMMLLRFQGLLGPFGKILTMLLKLAGSAAGITLIVGGIIAIFTHLDELKERFSGVFDKIKGGVSHIIDAIRHMLSEESPIGRFLQKVGKGLLWVVEQLGVGLAKCLDLIGDIIEAIDAMSQNKSLAQIRGERAMAVTDVTKYTQDAQFAQVQKLARAGAKMTDQQITFYQNYLQQMAALTGKAMGERMDPAKMQLYLQTAKELAQFQNRYKVGAGAVSTPEKPMFVQDFRGSRFDIEQKFAEGFDPDRVAVAFANDISSLGERKMTSTLGPQFIR